MQTLSIGRARYTLAPTRNVGELQAKISKISGKCKPTPIGKAKRSYPVYEPTMSTADYVALFYRMNAIEGAEKFFDPLNTDPCTLYSGEDSHEIIADDGPELAEVAAADVAPDAAPIAPESPTVAEPIAAEGSAVDAAPAPALPDCSQMVDIEGLSIFADDLAAACFERFGVTSWEACQHLPIFPTWIRERFGVPTDPAPAAADGAPVTADSEASGAPVPADSGAIVAPATVQTKAKRRRKPRAEFVAPTVPVHSEPEPVPAATQSAPDVGTRLFSVLVGKAGGKAIKYPPTLSDKALKLMRLMESRGFATLAETTANGITEELTLANMVSIFDPAPGSAEHSAIFEIEPAPAPKPRVSYREFIAARMADPVPGIVGLEVTELAAEVIEAAPMVDAEVEQAFADARNNPRVRTPAESLADCLVSGSPTRGILVLRDHPSGVCVDWAIKRNPGKWSDDVAAGAASVTREYANGRRVVILPPVDVAPFVPDPEDDETPISLAFPVGDPRLMIPAQFRPLPMLRA